MATIYPLKPNELFKVPRDDKVTRCKMCHEYAAPSDEIDLGPLYQYGNPIEGEEDEVSEYDFMPLEEYNTNSIQEDSLEQNNTEFDISMVEGMDDIPSVNIIPPSQPQSPQNAESFETQILENCASKQIDR